MEDTLPTGVRIDPVRGCLPSPISHLPSAVATIHHSKATITRQGGPLADFVSPSARERIVQDLADHFAQDRLTLPEYERRVELAYRAETADALQDLTRDLRSHPPVRLDQPAGMTAPGEARLANIGTRAKNFFALMSGVARRGRWTVPARIRAVACMGGIGLDLREATLTAPVTDIYVLAVMGGVEIIVPPDVRLETDGFAIMGGFEDQLREAASHDASAPLIRVHGLAIMGGVEARVAGVDEKLES